LLGQIINRSRLSRLVLAWRLAPPSHDADDPAVFVGLGGWRNPAAAITI
jgi:hypothetical protein